MASNRVAAITGGSAGVGRATALRRALDGWALAVCARRRDRLEQLAAEVTGAGGVAAPVTADVTCCGRLDVMMCNAGFGVVT